MTIQTIDQQRAKYALESLQTVLKEIDQDEQLDDKKKKERKKEWLSRANEIPAMIQMNGLGQTAAFYLSKKELHKRMYVILSEWLCKKNDFFPGAQDLIIGITSGNMQTYQVAQAEAQALLIWVKKFSRAYCKE